MGCPWDLSFFLSGFGLRKCWLGKKTIKNTCSERAIQLNEALFADEGLGKSETEKSLRVGVS